ncbi:GIY-YIG nuclease family protein [Candidatus Mycalebacterium sp.]
MPVYYALTNPAYRTKGENKDIKLVKFGKTKDVSSLPKRMHDLQTTGVPDPFTCICAIQVPDKDPKNYENLIHRALKRHRQSGREFFTIGHEGAIALMKMMPGKDVTSKVKPNGKPKSLETKKVEKTVLNKLPAFTFSSAKVPMGAILKFKGSPSLTAKVVGDKEIQFRGKKMSLSRSAGLVMKEKGLSPSVAGTAYWEYKGETLDERRRKVETLGKSSARRSAFTFGGVGLTKGAILKFQSNPSITAKVDGDKTIEFRGKKTSLSAAAKELLKRSTDVQGTLHWTVKGETLDERRRRLEGKKK